MSESLASLAQLCMTAEHAKNLIAQVAEAAAGASEELAAKIVALEEAISASPPGSSIPTGGIIIWSGVEVPDGWALCDGANGTPDLRGRFVLGGSEAHAAGTTGGSETVALTTAQLPSHNHEERARASGGIGTQNMLYTSTAGGSVSGRLIKQDAFESGTAMQLTTKNTGSGEAHSNMPPYYALAYIMKL